MRLGDRCDVQTEQELAYGYSSKCITTCIEQVVNEGDAIIVPKVDGTSL
jgi:hypothetical protein